MLLNGVPLSGACVRCFDESQQPSESATLDNMVARSTWSNVQLSGNSNWMTHSRGQGKLERCASLFHLVAELACQRFRDDCDSLNPSIALLEGGHGGQHQRQLARVQNLQPRRTTTPNKIKSFSPDIPRTFPPIPEKTFPRPSPDLLPILERPSLCLPQPPASKPYQAIAWKSSWSAMNIVPPFLRGGEVLSSARLRDLPSTMSACHYFLSPTPDVREHKRSTPRCYHQGQYHTTFSAATSRWTHHKHRTPSSKATITSMWPSNVLRVVVVLLWTLPTLRAEECVALNPQKVRRRVAAASTASQEVREKVFSKTGRRSEEVLSPFGGAYWGNDIERSEKSRPILRLCEVRPL